MTDITRKNDLMQWRTFRVAGIDGPHCREQEAHVAAEEPLTIRINGQPLVTLMRTPGEEIPLCVGFLLTEGVVASYADILLVRHCRNAAASDDVENPNVVNAKLRDSVDVSQVKHRVAYSSCGICGAEAIDLICRSVKPLQACQTQASILADLPGKMRRHQRLFAETGGTHAAALFDAAGELLFLSEDIGRHNALDKTVGKAAIREADLSGKLLMLSGRISYEMIAKAARAGIATVAAVSAPTTLAVETAIKLGITLIGFVRDGRLTIYAGYGNLP